VKPRRPKIAIPEIERRRREAASAPAVERVVEAAKASAPCGARALVRGFEATCIRERGHAGAHVSIRRTTWSGRPQRDRFAEPRLTPPRQVRNKPRPRPLREDEVEEASL
jgi:hypothetical protein